MIIWNMKISMKQKSFFYLKFAIYFCIHVYKHYKNPTLLII